MKAYILAGGQSLRMGQDKGLVCVGGRPLTTYLISTLKAFDLKIIAHHPGYRGFGLPVLRDVVPGCGPLGGIFTALHDAGEDALILSVDTPFFSQKNINLLMKDYQPDRITLGIENQKVYPLFGIYPFTLYKELEQQLSGPDLRLMDFVHSRSPHWVPLALSPLERLNLNTPYDLDIAQRLMIQYQPFGKISELLPELPPLHFPMDFSEFKAHLEATCPALTQMNYQILVDNRVVSEGEISPQHSLGLMPPFSGG